MITSRAQGIAANIISLCEETESEQRVGFWSAGWREQGEA